MREDRSIGRNRQGRHLAALWLVLMLGACGGSEAPDNLGNGVNDTSMLEDSMEMTSNAAFAAENTAPPAPPACDAPPANGARLEGERLSGEGHQLVIRNGTDGDAIIKIRDAGTDRLVTSFFVVQNDSASVSGLPDGSYYFQYAFGTLAEDCRSFATITSANRFPDTESFVTEEVETAEGPRLRRSRLSFTLYPVPQGNIQPTPIDPSEFNR